MCNACAPTCLGLPATFAFFCYKFGTLAAHDEGVEGVDKIDGGVAERGRE